MLDRPWPARFTFADDEEEGHRMIGLSDETSVPSPAEWEDGTESLFGPKGVLCVEHGLEHRPQQQAMASAVVEQFSLDESLLVEAGTGVGKSLAYLLPGIMRAVETGRKLLVSTHTIALQQQLEKKDIPLCRTILERRPALRRFAGFSCALLVGKANYLCNTRLKAALGERESLFQDAESNELRRIAEWAGGSKTGLLQEISPPPRPDVWDLVNADSSVCSRDRCGCDACFYQKARARILSADVVILNHSLLFSLIQHTAPGGGGDGEDEGREATRGILFPGDFLVLDEGHTVPEVATDHLGLSISSFGLMRLLHSIYHPERDRGLLKRHGLSRHRDAVGEVLTVAALFFDNLLRGPLARGTLFRVREPDSTDASLAGPLLRVAQVLEEVGAAATDDRVREELKDAQRRVDAWRSGLLHFCSGPEGGDVHWMERSGRKGDIVTLRTAPLDIAPQLRELLFGRRTSVIVTSATLAAGRNMEGFASTIGADAVRAERFESPFDFESQMLVNIAEDMPDQNGADPTEHAEWLRDMTAWCVQKSQGGTLLLFTSYRELNLCIDRLQSEAAALGREFYAQGGHVSRHEMIRRFRAAGNAVLLGTDTFWTGVDVPGQALAHVVIVRLPFEHPSHPVAEARSEWVRSRGGVPFTELHLPAALRAFRQGIGRLIRSATDTGMVTILDSRILTKPYSNAFLECLPTPRHHRFTRETREQRFRVR